MNSFWRAGALPVWRASALAVWRASALAVWRASALAVWRASALATLGVAPALVACSPRDQGGQAVASGPPLMARADLFGDPVRSHPILSPRGDMIAFLAPRDGLLNVWVVPVDSIGSARPLTDERVRGVSRFSWAPDGASILFYQDESGNDIWRLYAVDVASGTPRALTPAGVRADILGSSVNQPGTVIVAMGERNPAYPDVYSVSIADGARTLIARNVDSDSQPGFTDFVVDRENNLRLGVKSRSDGASEVFARQEDGSWKSLFVIPFEDVLQSTPIGFEAGGRTFLMFDSTGRDRAALVRVDAATGAKTVLGESQRADVDELWLDPTTNMPEAYSANYLRREWRALDPAAQADLDFLDAQLQGEPDVVSRSLDDRRWIVEEEGPTTPTRSYLYDRSDPANRRLSLLFRHRPALDHLPMQPMAPFEFEARDGLTIVSYLTLPPGSDADNDNIPDHPVPLVLAPHGGPWIRDSYGYNALHQWLANRGYAVLSVNFRGSSGFGKAFLNAGNAQWGGRMQDDLIDAVSWAIARRVADPQHIAIAGGSYGGYAALMALAQSPDLFKCGIAYAPPIDLSTLLANIPAPYAAYRAALYARIGDPRTAQGRALLHDRSPLNLADKITAPLMLAFGARDPFSSRADADALAANIRARSGSLMYFFFPNEGHRMGRPENRQAFYAIAEQFLGQCLGGRVEPVGTAFDGADLRVIDGAAQVPGLSAFVRRPAPRAATPAIVPGESPGDAPAPEEEGEG